MGWDSTEKGRPKLLDLSLRPFRGTRVVYCHIGIPAFAVQRFLGSLAGVKFLLAPTATGRTGKPQIARHVDKNHFIAPIVPTGLDQQRGVEDRNLGARGRKRVGLLPEQPADLRMDQLLQVFSFLFRFIGWTKDHSGQPATVDSSFRVKNRVSPSASGGSLERRQRERLASGLVGVEHAGPEPGEMPSHRALAARHAA